MEKIYIEYFISEIKIPLDKIKDSDERLLFLKKRKLDFASQNTGFHAEMVISKINGLILDTEHEIKKAEEAEKAEKHETYNIPNSLNIEATDEDIKNHFYKMITGNNKIFPKDTKFGYFTYAFFGKPIPENKLPYKPLILVGTKEQLYRYLHEDILKNKQKTLQNKYKEGVTSLIVDKNGNFIKKLSNPK